MASRSPRLPLVREFIARYRRGQFCSACGKALTVADMHEAFYVHGQPVHRRCAVYQRERDRT